MGTVDWEWVELVVRLLTNHGISQVKVDPVTGEIRLTPPPR